MRTDLVVLQPPGFQHDAHPGAADGALVLQALAAQSVAANSHVGTLPWPPGLDELGLEPPISRPLYSHFRGQALAAVLAERDARIRSTKAGRDSVLSVALLSMAAGIG